MKQASPRKRRNLLDLPAEIRNEIYSQALHLPQQRYWFPISLQQLRYKLIQSSDAGSVFEDRRPCRNCKKDVYHTLRTPGLLLVCRAIAAEATRFYYESNTFYLDQSMHQKLRHAKCLPKPTSPNTATITQALFSPAALTCSGGCRRTPNNAKMIMPERAVYYQEVAIVCGFGREYNLKAAFGSKDSIRWDVGTEALIQPILELAPRLRCMVESGESVEVAVNEYAAVALSKDAELHESETNSDHSFTATRLVFADLVGRELDGQRIERLLQSCLQSSRSSQPPPVKLGIPADGDEPWEQMLIEVAIFADDLKSKDERFRARGGQGYLFV